MKYLTVFKDKVAILYISRTLMKYLTVFKDKVAGLISRTTNKLFNNFQGQGCKLCKI